MVSFIVDGGGPYQIMNVTLERSLFHIYYVMVNHFTNEVINNYIS